MNRPLTARQLQVLECIQTFVDTTGMPPTRAEIAKQLGFRSANAAEEQLRALAHDSHIQLDVSPETVPAGVDTESDLDAVRALLCAEQ